MQDLLAVIKAVLNNEDKKFNITPSLLNDAKENGMISFLSLVMDENTSLKLQKFLLDNYANEIKRHNAQKEELSQGFPWDFFLACCLQIIYNSFYKRFHAGENNE